MTTNVTEYPVLAVEMPSVSTHQEASNALVQMVTNSALLEEIALVKSEQIQNFPLENEIQSDFISFARYRRVSRSPRYLQQRRM
jgi:hypothetical protein